MSHAHVPSSAAVWSQFSAADATHDQLKRLSTDVDTDAVWLVRRDEHALDRATPVQSGLYRIPVGRFNFESPGDESCYVIEGAADVQLEDGEEVHLRPGDMAFWPRGTRSEWTVTAEFVQFSRWSDEPSARTGRAEIARPA